MFTEAPINQFFEFSKIGYFRPGSIPRAQFKTLKLFLHLADFLEPCSYLFQLFALGEHLDCDLPSKFGLQIIKIFIMYICIFKHKSENQILFVISIKQNFQNLHKNRTLTFENRSRSLILGHCIQTTKGHAPVKYF